MANSLSGVLANIPGLAGYEAARQQDQEMQLGQLRQVGGLQAIIAQAQKQQLENQFRQEISTARTPEEKLAVASKYMGPDALGRMEQGSLDRAATREAATINATAMREQRLAELTQRGEQEIARVREAAAQQRITREEADTREARMKENMARLVAALRPPRAEPAPRNLQLTTDAAGNQLIVNPDGTTRPLTTQDGAGVQKPVAADKPMTEFQGKAALYGTRSAQSDKVLKALEDKISTAGLAVGQATGVIGNQFMSSEQRRVDQAQRDFVNAVLRQESGAVISDAEFANAKKQYFPAPGDDANTVAQKRANRQLAIQGFARMAGPKGALDIKAITDEPLLPGVSGNPVTPQANKAGGYVEVRKTADGRTLGKKADGTIEEIK